MGMLIEDWVAPCGFQLARAIFQTEEVKTGGPRIKRGQPVRSGERMDQVVWLLSRARKDALTSAP
jgi:hypothetical protein